MEKKTILRIFYGIWMMVSFGFIGTGVYGMTTHPGSISGAHSILIIGGCGLLFMCMKGIYLDRKWLK